MPSTLVRDYASVASALIAVAALLVAILAYRVARATFENKTKPCLGGKWREQKPAKGKGTLFTLTVTNTGGIPVQISTAKLFLSNGRFVPMVLNEEYRSDDELPTTLQSGEELSLKPVTRVRYEDSGDYDEIPFLCDRNRIVCAKVSTPFGTMSARYENT